MLLAEVHTESTIRLLVGRRFFDVQLVAAMLGNGMKTMYTYNMSGFEPFTSSADITVIGPQAR